MIKVYIATWGIRLECTGGVHPSLISDHLKRLGFTVDMEYGYIKIFPPEPPPPDPADETIADVEDALMEES